ncbi:reticuline oxidase-like protein-like protein [Corchorus olitorius]|uniref:Reticuline oxidase-like protein-like protein n=1 Tax=Corchorus olitorius TaxID=93759 RepID=A0A1R3IBD9_9ROSI|nr:reticuline oxidase-like protein-like protein [Corchorus olitorius]
MNPRSPSFDPSMKLIKEALFHQIDARFKTLIIENPKPLSWFEGKGSILSKKRGKRWRYLSKGFLLQGNMYLISFIPLFFFPKKTKLFRFTLSLQGFSGVILCVLSRETMCVYSST